MSKMSNALKKTGEGSWGRSEPGTVQDNIDSLFQPDSVAEFQFLEALRKKTVLEPEKKLMLAVLEDGIKSFQDHAGARTDTGRKLFHEAEAWILERDRSWVFSFESICDALGFEPSYVRAGLLRCKQQPANPHPSLSRKRARA
ncbi:MAG TPA: hypothetical protein VNO43_16675 [Candidatus Eisenbacteria bacterium]|nr:hypothetical protein [Candidatus Eisenbacteria bacterium]